MKIIHTADWHLGCSLGTEKRFSEHDKFLNELCQIIEKEQVEALIIAGDVFDTHMPPNLAAEQYYNFLLEAGRAGARYIIVTGGNHDSAAYLEAPKEVLKHLSVQVFATASKNHQDMIIELKERSGQTAALLGAVPYLHERDLIVTESGQSLLERETVIKNAMLDYYCKIAEAMTAADPDVPHIVTGHLFAADNGQKNESWIGSLMSIDTGEFPDSIDYLALGHLHDARTLKTPHQCCVRYPGAPINISFRELAVQKSVTLIDTRDIRNIQEIPLQPSQDMRIVQGSYQEIYDTMIKLIAEDRSIWCSVENTGEYEPALTDRLFNLVQQSKVKIIVCRNRATNPEVLMRLPEDRPLSDLTPEDVFKLLLKEHNRTGEAADKLAAAFKQLETEVYETEE